jgi:hypothetical protein
MTGKIVSLRTPLASLRGAQRHGAPKRFTFRYSHYATTNSANATIALSQAIYDDQKKQKTAILLFNASVLTTSRCEALHTKIRRFFSNTRPYGPKNL